MKGIKLIFLMITGFCAQSQDINRLIQVDPETNKIKFQEVVDESGSKSDLFKKCVYWLNGFYKDPSRITTIRDEPSGKIAGRHQFRIYYQDSGNTKQIAGMIKYTFTIDLKDDKYRYTIDNLVLKSQTNMPIEKWLDKDDPAYDTRWDDYLRQVVDFVDRWSSSLKEKMKPEPEKKKDDW